MSELPFAEPALREAYRALMRDAAGADHLDEAAWDRLAAGEAESPERDALFDHIVSCERCSRIWRGVLTLQQQAAAQGLAAPVRNQARPIWRSPAVALAMAATLLLVVGGVFLSQRPASDNETVRGTALASIDGLMMAYDPDGVPAFVWPPVPAATHYRIEVFTEDGRPLWSADAAAPPARWPAETPRAKGTYRWRVEAFGGEGAMARSRLMPVELTR
jgi:hypothetical protein